MAMMGVVCHSVKQNEWHRLLSPLAALVGIFILNLLTPPGITVWFGYALLLWYLSCLSLKPAVCLTFGALARPGLITGAAFPFMLCQQTYSSNLLLKQGTI
jgi:hypothetical protein